MIKKNTECETKLNFLILIFAVVAFVICSQVQAADIRDDTFVSNGADIHIYLDGKIVKGDYEKFRRVTVAAIIANIYDSGIKRIWIVPNSNGGNVSEAMQIGKAVSDLNATVIIRKNRVCASACVFIWMGGPIPGGVTGGGKLLVHNPYIRGRKFGYEDYERIMLQAQQEVSQFIKDMNLPVETVMNEILGTNSNKLSPMKQGVAELVSNRRSQMQFEWVLSHCGMYPQKEIAEAENLLSHPWIVCSSKMRADDHLRRYKKYVGIK